MIDFRRNWILFYNDQIGDCDRFKLSFSFRQSSLNAGPHEQLNQLQPGYVGESHTDTDLHKLSAEIVKNKTDTVQSEDDGQGFENSAERIKVKHVEERSDGSVENDEDTELVLFEEMEVEACYEREHYGVA